MTKWNVDRGRKVTGGRIRPSSKKKKYQRGSLPLLTEVGKEKRKVERRRGGLEKVRVVKAEFANVTNPKTNKTKKVKILDVVSNPSNPHYVRRNIITKGTMIKTELGEAKIVSRPSQDGVVNAVITSKK